MQIFFPALSDIDDERSLWSALFLQFQAAFCIILKDPQRNLRCLQTFHFSSQASGGMACLSLQPMIPNTICTQRLSISLSNNIHTFIMGLDLVEDVEKDFLQKLS